MYIFYFNLLIKLLRKYYYIILIIYIIYRYKIKNVYTTIGITYFFLRGPLHSKTFFPANGIFFRNALHHSIPLYNFKHTRTLTLHSIATSYSSNIN